MTYFFSERLEITTRSNYNNLLILISCHVGMKYIVFRFAALRCTKEHKNPKKRNGFKFKLLSHASSPRLFVVGNDVSDHRS